MVPVSPRSLVAHAPRDDIQARRRTNLRIARNTRPAAAHEEPCRAQDRRFVPFVLFVVQPLLDVTPFGRHQEVPTIQPMTSPLPISVVVR